MSGSTAGFRYSTPIVIPDASLVEDNKTNEELSYAFNALRTMAARLDEVSGALSPLQTAWSGINYATSIIGGNMMKVYAPATENIAYGAMVNLYNLSPTTVQARNAQASSSVKAAHAWCNTPGGVLLGSFGEFICGPGLNTGIVGLVPGTHYYLSPTSATGQVQSAIPVTPGQIRQLIGIAVTDTQLIVGALNGWEQL